MRSTVEPLEGNKVKLSIEIEESEFESALSQAYKRIAQEVRIPGFRPGKAPRRLLEARLGPETARREALRDAVPGYFVKALRETETDAISQPEIEITGGEDAGAVSFDAVVQIRPTVSIPGYQSLEVTVPSPLVTEEEIDAQIDRLRANDAELVDVARPAKDGDVVRIDVRATLDGTVADEMSDYSHEIGKVSGFPEEVDENLRGAKVGDILEFGAKATERALAFRIFVKQVQTKQLPDTTDEWAEEASEFDTLAELRADFRSRLGEIKREHTASAIHDAAAGALAELVDTAPPEVMVESATERRLYELSMQLEGQGRDLAGYLQALRLSGEDLVDQLKEGAVRSVKVELALRALADAEGIEATDQDIERELAAVASQVERSVDQLRDDLERNDKMQTVRSDVRKSKALEWLVSHVELVDSDGQPIDRATLEPPPSAEEPAAKEDADDEPAIEKQEEQV